jgi:hypothetical protein
VAKNSLRENASFLSSRSHREASWVSLPPERASARQAATCEIGRSPQRTFLYSAWWAALSVSASVSPRDTAASAQASSLAHGGASLACRMSAGSKRIRSTTPKCERCGCAFKYSTRSNSSGKQKLRAATFAARGSHSNAKKSPLAVARNSGK